MLITDNTVLVIIDIQGNLYQSMDDKLFLLENNRKMIQGIPLFGIPIIVTEQIPEKLGPTIPEISDLLAGVKPISKECFSCWKNQNFMKEVMDSAAVYIYHEILKAIKANNLVHAVKNIGKYAVLFRGNPETPNYREVDSFEKRFFQIIEERNLWDRLR